MDMNFDQYKMIKSVQILIRNDDLIQTMSCNEELDKKDERKSLGDFELFMHYPRQLLRTASIHKEAITGSNFTLKGQRFTLKTMEVTRILCLLYILDYINSKY